MSQPAASGPISLTRLQTLIREEVDRAHPLPYWVTAEISEMKVNYSGHCYLELVEKGGENHIPKAKASAVIWRNSYAMISSYFSGATGTPLAAGLKVLVKVVITYHELYGLSLQVTDIDPTYTMGDMERQRQETIARLRKDGVFDMNRELGLPLVIQRLAVVSSRHAAGYQDFMQELSRSGYRFEVTLFDAFMQGAGTENSVIAALDAIADEADSFDAVVMIRGGGAQSDLGAFNSYRLCCHLAQFPLPVITGIGHDKDQSVADLVAARALKTPTAVAVFLNESMERFESGIDALFTAVSDAATALIDREKQAIAGSTAGLRLVAGRMVQEMRMLLTTLQHDLERRCERIVQSGVGRLELFSNLLGRHAGATVRLRRTELERRTALLRNLSRQYVSACRHELDAYHDRAMSRDPERILEMGFAVVRSGGKTVIDGAQLRSGDAMQVVMRRSVVDATVDRVAPRNGEGADNM